MADHPQPAEQPFRLNLEQQRNCARQLLRALKAGEPEAQDRFLAHQPPDRPPTLTAVQHVIAREVGLPSWPRLKAHAQAMEAERAAFRTAPDTDRLTLHIRCGSDIAQPLKQAGFTGDFLEYSDPICQGPVTGSLDQRARFISKSYSGLTEAAVRENLAAAEAALDAAPDHDRVVLWFEHDSYDQLLLARCLARFAVRRPPRLDLVCVDAFPGSRRFRGLGQLPPEALRLLWTRRRPVTASQLRLGTAIWAALQAPDPVALAAIARSGTPALPQAAPALLRHLRELPATHDGLGLTERLVLELLGEQERTIGRVFGALTERDPLPFLGDLMLGAIVESMARAADPALTIEPGEPWYRRMLRLTPAGHAGNRDYLARSPEPRWIGGVEVVSGQPHWRWDDTTESPVRHD